MSKDPITVDVGNVFSYLRTEDPEIKALLYRSLRFRAKGYIFSPSYQKFRRSGGKRGWDGFTNFFTLIKGRFGTGLLPEVIKALDVLGADYKVVDNRPNVEYESISEDIFGDQVYKGNPVVLRDYQVELGNRALQLKRGIIKAATGAGKTIAFSAIVKSLSGCVPTIVLFRSRTLVNQTYSVFRGLGIENVGRVHMDYFEPNIITCSTIQSIHHLKPIIPKVKALIIDECHEYTSNKSVRIVRSFQNTPVILGFSATPFDRKDKVQKYTLKSLIGPQLGEVTTKELQERNILAESKVHIVPVIEPKIPYALFDEAYVRGIVENRYRNDMIRKIVDSYDRGKILILVEKLDHGDNLERILPNALWIHGSTEEEERERAASFLKDRRRKKAVVIASRIWAQGVDIPEIDVLINASAGKSERSAIQKLGRGLRKSEGKDFLDFYDFYDATNTYLERHAKSRLKTYKMEGHEVIPMEPLK